MKLDAFVVVIKIDCAGSDGDDFFKTHSMAIEFTIKFTVKMKGIEDLI
jgi:hypothetical protein